MNSFDVDFASGDEPVFPDPLTCPKALAVPIYFGELAHHTYACPKPLPAIQAEFKAMMSKLHMTYEANPDVAAGLCVQATHQFNYIEVMVDIFLFPEGHTVSFRHVRGDRFVVNNFIHLVLCPELNFTPLGHLLPSSPPALPPYLQTQLTAAQELESEANSIQITMDMLTAERGRIIQGLSSFWSGLSSKTDYYVQGGRGLTVALGVVDLFQREGDDEMRILCMGGLSVVLKSPNLCPHLHVVLARVVEQGKQDPNFHVRHYAELS